jgi:NitT/TauT family transport system permease protein
MSMEYLSTSGRRSARTKRWIRRQIPTVLAGLVFVLLWEGIARYINDNRIVADVGYTQESLIEEAPTIAPKLIETFSSVLVAFVLAVLVGVGLGVVIAEIYSLRRMTMPLVIFAYGVPHPVLAPMFIIWFLIGDADIVLLSFTGPSAYVFPEVAAADAQTRIAIDGVSTFGAWTGFFPVFISTLTGINALEERFEHLGTVLGATRWQMVRYFRFYRALPNIASSVKSTVQLSIIGVIVAEFLSSSSGIGFEIVLAWKTAELGYMFGVLLVVMAGSYVFFQSVVWALKRLTPPGTVT